MKNVVRNESFQLFILINDEMTQTPIPIDTLTIFNNGFFYVSMLLIFLGVVGIAYFSNKLLKKTNENNRDLKQQIAKIDIIRKEHSEALEKIRLEMLRREEERTRQWIESEKETLHVLGGVSELLDLSEKFNKLESTKILAKLEEINNHIAKNAKQY